MWFRMSALNRPATSLDHSSSESRVVQIYPHPAQDSSAYCPLQVTPGDTARNVIKNAILMLGLDSNQRYRLIEVTKTDEEETELDCDDLILELVLLWPPETQKWHPKTDGYYFIIQQITDGKSRSEEFDDLCNLPDVTEDTVTETLRQRFDKYKIYTYASNILVAINPHKCLPVYNPKYVKKYENQPLGKLSPHIFAIAAAAFRNMLSSQINQCIVISGESGSGKTESSSFLVHCLTALSQQTYSSGLERIILGAAPVLEAFGNAKTEENDNSSRFGKFIQLNYLESGVIRGAVIEKYLLEKSRLVSRDRNERNYHVFYYLLVGASKDEQKEFYLLKPQDYLYLRQGDLELDDEESLGQQYKRLHQAMEMVGFLPSTKKHIFSILSVILHLGNLTFSLSQETQGLEVGPEDVLVTLSELLKVKKEVLVKALTVRRAVASDDTAQLQFSPEQASKMRDSMAQSLYSTLFDWIIFHINHALLNRRDMEESVPCLSIGVLDMFGFEDLQKNSFEQLCINFTNEKLQCYINQCIFTSEQEEYVSEGIEWQNVEYTDNTGCIDLMSGKPSGIFELLDSESSLSDSSNERVLEKMKQQHQDSPFFVSNSESTFSVQHFAGSVTYNIKDFVEKNSEHMRSEVVCLLRSSERAFLHHLVCSSPRALFRWGVLRATLRIVSVFNSLARNKAELIAAKRASRKSLKELKRASDRLSSNSWTLDFSFDRSDEQHPLDVFEDIFANYEKRKKTKGSRQKQLIPKNLIDLRSLEHIVGVTVHDRTSKSTDHPQGPIPPPTVCTQFQASLQKLMERIEKARPFFIVCLRSNNEMKEMHFDPDLVKRQVQCTGLLQMVLMQKAGYSAKYTFKEFVEKFWILLPKKAPPTPEHISHLLEKKNLDKSTYQIGKTKVFLKERERQFLQETLNSEIMHRIVVLQRWFRACLIRMHFLQKKDATRLIQRCWREFYEKQNRAATVIQTAWRTSLQRSLSEEQEENSRPGRDSFTKKGLKRQPKIELSPGRTPQSEPGQKPRSREGTPPTLHRPLSLPSDTGSAKTSLQRYKDMSGIKEKADRWRERLSEGDPTDETSPERRRDRRRDDYHNKGKSMSADELSTQSSSDSSTSPGEKIPAEPDGARFSLPPRSSEDEGHHAYTTPERAWFARFLKKRSPKYIMSPESSQDKSVTLPRFSPHPYQMPSQSSSRPNRNPTIRISRATRPTEWNASLDREITDPKELRNLDEFLGNHVNELKSRVKELSPTEHIFLTATMAFRNTIKSMFSVKKPQIAYKDLMKGYQNKVNALAGPKEKSEVSLVVNLFQSVLDIFVRAERKRMEPEPVKTNKQTKKRRKKEKCPDSPLDHLFSTYQVNIMQSCDLCGSYIWAMEKAYMCSACKLICHKKCLSKIITDCSTRCSRMDDNVPGSLHFGVQVCVLTSKANPVPKVVELLLMHVELNGLYTEGIYRKSGSACRARELHQILETNPESACLDNYPIHTITGLVKRWLRELPDPLMTYALYNDFLHAAELPERSERIRAVYQKVDELPPSNYNTLERLIFHLVKVAREEEHNKMTANSLAIVFAPCILRSPDSNDPFLAMKDVGKITMCVEVLISEQSRRYSEMMQNIQELEYAEALAENELQLRRQNTVVVEKPTLDVPERHDSDETEKTLIERIKSIRQEKVDLACRLPDLEQEHSDNDNLDSSSSMSTESLEDRLKSLESEGKVTLRLSKKMPDSPTNKADLAQRVRTLRAQTDDEQLEFFPSEPVHSPKSKNKPSMTEQQGSFDHLDIPYIDEDEEHS